MENLKYTSMNPQKHLNKGAHLKTRNLKDPPAKKI